MNEHKQQMREMIFAENAPKPSFLVHYVGGLHSPDYEAHKNVVQNGLQANRGKERGRWDLELNRPNGIFFFGPDMDQNLSNVVRVEVDDLDTDKLFAYPTMLADALARLNDGERTFVNQPEEWKQALRELAAEVEAVPYAQYDGSFAAEWIYTDDITADQIK